MTEQSMLQVQFQPQYAVILQVKDITVAVTNCHSFQTLVAFAKTFLTRYGYSEFDYTKECPSYDVILQWIENRRTLLPITLFQPLRIQLGKVPIL